MNRFRKTFFLIKELGLSQLLPYAAYQLRLRSGLVKRVTPPGGWKENVSGSAIQKLRIAFPKMDKDQLTAMGVDSSAAISEADMVLQGLYRPFGGETAELSFALQEASLEHWTHYGATFAGIDIKLTWEPARFTWVYPLIRAYTLTGDDRYPEAFWQHFGEFVKFNPINLGPNWASSQEAALRVLALLFALSAFQSSATSTDQRMQSVASHVFQCAKRILITLDYARSQNNNHLISEALGLILAGTFLADVTPLARSWLKLGFSVFEKGILAQLEPDGTYSQHSVIYHRMMLQLALLYYIYAQYNGHPFDMECHVRLCAATHWLAAQVDNESGDAPNLGHNDGTLLLPFGALNYRDFRPTVQAAGCAFIGKRAYIPGGWDELSAWLGLPSPECQSTTGECMSPSPVVHRVGDRECWGTLRAVSFHARPAHADQLNVDLWWHGHNIAQDAGTYLYNAPPPWDNTLGKTCVHNTLTVNGMDQMERAGKFLWLDRLNAEVLTQMESNSISAQMLMHTRPPLHHRRTLTFRPGEGFKITDELWTMRALTSPLNVDLQWLLPDWSYSMPGDGILLSGEEYSLRLTLEAVTDDSISTSPVFSLVRAGVTLEGDIQNPIRGWVSQTYNQKIPALSIALHAQVVQKTTLISLWNISALPSNSR